MIVKRHVVGRSRRRCRAARSVPTPKRSSASGSVESADSTGGRDRARALLEAVAERQCVRLTRAASPRARTATRADRRPQLRQCPSTDPSGTGSVVVTLAMRPAACCRRSTPRRREQPRSCASTPSPRRAQGADRARTRLVRVLIRLELRASDVPAISMSPEELSTERRRGAAAARGAPSQAQRRDASAAARRRPPADEATRAASGPDPRRRGVSPPQPRLSRGQGPDVLRCARRDCGDEPARRTRPRRRAHHHREALSRTSTVFGGAETSKTPSCACARCGGSR